MNISIKSYIAILFLSFACIRTNAQSNISFQCAKLNLSKSESLQFDPPSEDDPGDLANAIARFSAVFPKDYTGTDQMFEFKAPTHIGIYQLNDQNQEGKNDSLWAKLVYNTNKNAYRKEIEAYPKDFSITVTRYDAVKGGVVEGSFKGNMQSYIPWKHETDIFSVKGNFRTTRTGKPGDECRKQRPSEKIVISKAINIFDNYFAAPLASMDWQINEKETGQSSQISNFPSPYRPMMLCSDFYDLKLNIDPKSAYGKMLQDSAEYYAKLSSLQATKNMYRILSMTKVEIRILENDPYLQTHDAPGSKTKFTLLHIPGTGYAYQYFEPNTDNPLARPEEHTSLYFGNWKGIRNTHKYVPYPFMHKRQAAVIENFVVTITAPAAVANEIIKKIDWTKLNEALSK